MSRSFPSIKIVFNNAFKFILNVINYLCFESIQYEVLIMENNNDHLRYSDRQKSCRRSLRNHLFTDIPVNLDYHASNVYLQFRNDLLMNYKKVARDKIT